MPKRMDFDINRTKEAVQAVAMTKSMGHERSGMVGALFFSRFRALWETRAFFFWLRIAH